MKHSRILIVVVVVVVVVVVLVSAAAAAVVVIKNRTVEAPSHSKMPKNSRNSFVNCENREKLWKSKSWNYWILKERKFFKKI